MKIAILGTRGIPNNYGGFEQFAEYLSLGLKEYGCEVSVYNSSTHPFQKDHWNGIHLIRCFDPEDRIGTAGQFIYDLNCILDSRKRKFDIILQLGYTSSSIWHWLLPKKRSLILTNMDGMEWKRTKYSEPVKRFLKYAEKLAVRSSHFLIADSIGIQNYLQQTYKAPSTFIAYGAHLVKEYEVELIAQYNLEQHQYDMLIARLEPENNIEMILNGFVLSNSNRSFVVIGNHQTKFGSYLKERFDDPRIRFLGAIYDIKTLNALRMCSNLYFHGHSVGGTNPSLLEAMASEALICYHDNEFNAHIVGEEGFKFASDTEVSQLIANISKVAHGDLIELNKDKISSSFSWGKIIESYHNLFIRTFKR